MSQALDIADIAATLAQGRKVAKGGTLQKHNLQFCAEKRKPSIKGSADNKKVKHGKKTEKAEQDLVDLLKMLLTKATCCSL